MLCLLHVLRVFLLYKQLPLAISPDIDNTFENYYVSPNNQIAIAVLNDFLVSGGEHFFYLWGEPKSGITHLLEALQNKAAMLTIQYLPLKDLIAYSPVEIIEGIDQLDMVCIDDLEVVVDKPQWQETLFHLFNRLRDEGKYLLIGSHISPRNLTMSLADLKSRLQWGTVFNIQALSDTDKYHAMQFRAQRLGIQLSDEVVNYLLQRVNRSTGALFELLKQLDHASLAEQRKLTIPFVKKVLALC